MKTLKQIMNEISETISRMSRQSADTMAQSPSPEIYRNIYSYLDQTKDTFINDVVPKYENDFDSLVDAVSKKYKKGSAQAVSIEQAFIDWLYDNDFAIENNKILKQQK